MMLTPKQVDGIAIKIFDKAASDCIKEKVCIVCSHPSTNFSGPLYELIFEQYGLCEHCQKELDKGVRT
jgi:hypothetical protein